jgi:hypothetical protein
MLETVVAVAVMASLVPAAMWAAAAELVGIQALVVMVVVLLQALDLVVLAAAVLDLLVLKALAAAEV